MASILRSHSVSAQAPADRAPGISRQLAAAADAALRAVGPRSLQIRLAKISGSSNSKHHCNEDETSDDLNGMFDC